MSGILKKIGTHDGIFHCDEILACFMLKKLPEFVYSEIIRTRDESVLSTCDAVVDVGGVYDPKNNRFDHHQREFTLTMNSLNPDKPWKVKLSSAGLVYYHYGEKVLRSILGPSHDPELIAKLFDYVYENFVQEIDGIDNGLQMFDGEPKYTIHTNLSSRIEYLNPSWNNQKPFDSLKVFHSAMDLVGREFIDKVQYFINAWWPARKIVDEAVSNRFNVHNSGEIIELQEMCPWKDHLLQIEKEKDLSGVTKYVIFKDKNWRIQAVPQTLSSFQCRLFLPEKWRGLRDEELNRVSGIDGCIFVHVSGFIGENKTREGVLTMAKQSLAFQEIS